MTAGRPSRRTVTRACTRSSNSSSSSSSSGSSSSSSGGGGGGGGTQDGHMQRAEGSHFWRISRTVVSTHIAARAF